MAEAQGYSAKDLDKRVTLQEATITKDSAAGSSKAWADFPLYPEVWAKVRELSGREVNLAAQRKATVSVVVAIRRRGDVSSTNQRVVLPDGRAGEIKWIAESGRDFLELFIEVPSL